MKKTLSLVLALVLCFALAASAMAEEATNSPELPEITLVDAPQQILLTTLLGAKDKTTDIPQEERDLLISVYEALAEGSMELPVDDSYVIRDLISVTYAEGFDHMKEELEEEGKSLTLTFDIGVSETAEVRVFSFVDGEWLEAISVTNNGDGTVTVVFEDICPVAFAVKE